MMEFKHRLKHLRNKEGKSQVHLAKKIGISLRTYCNYEYGNTEPTVSVLQKIAHELNTSIAELISDTDD